MSKFGAPVIYLVAFAAFLIPTLMTLTSSGSITDVNSSYYKNAVSSTNTFLVVSYTLFVIVVIAIVIGFVVTLISDPKSSLKSLIGLIGILVVGSIAFAMSGNEVTAAYKKVSPTLSSFMSQLIESTLILSYWMILLTIIVIIATEIYNAVRS